MHKGEQEKTDALSTPGPTKYSPHSKLTQTKVPAWTMGKDKKLKKSISPNPDPGLYEYKPTIGKGTKYTIGQKRYDIDDLNSPNNSKKKMLFAYKTLGPGFYSPSNIYKSISYTINKKAQSHSLKKKEDIIPDVGKYDLRREKSFVAPCHKFSTEKKSNLHLGPIDVPGPQRYEIIADSFGKGGPRYSFSRTKRPEIIRTMTPGPGPGKYQHQEFVGNEGCKISFPRQYSSIYELSDTPGPGKYNPTNSDKPNTPSYSISTLKRKEILIEKLLSTPGFERYNPKPLLLSQRSRGPEWLIPKSNREPNYNTEKIPGPGHYQVNNDSFPTGPKYTIGGRYEIKIKENAPDPGKYDVPLTYKPKEPQFYISKSKKEEDIEFENEKKNNLPGPGSYYYKDAPGTKELTFPMDKKFRKKN